MPKTNLEIAQNPLTNPEKLAKLSNNLDPKVRKFVAKNYNTESVTLSNMIYDLDEEVLINLAQNVKLDKKSLTILYENENPVVSKKAKLTYDSIFRKTPRAKHSELQKLNLVIQNLENQQELILNQKRLLNRLKTEREFLQN